MILMILMILDSYSCTFAHDYHFAWRFIPLEGHRVLKNGVVMVMGIVLMGIMGIALL